MNNRVEELFHGYAIVHATLENKDRVAFILKEEVTQDTAEELDYIPGDDELATMAVLYEPSVWHSRDNFAAYRWREGVRNAFAVIEGRQRTGSIVICGISGGGQAGEFNVITDSEWYSKEDTWVELPFEHKAMLCATNIDSEVYFGGNLRNLFKRTGKNEWIDLTDEEQHPNLHEDIRHALESGHSISSVPVGFDGIDGFSRNDLYACGEQGELWHYNGERWRRLAPPVNFDMQAIVCAGDDNVYAGGDMGGLIRGRFDPQSGHEQWQIIKNPLNNTEQCFNSLAWFQDRLYLGNDWALYRLTKEDRIEKVVFPDNGFHQYSFQNVNACDTALLSYGPHQALTFDGERWEQVVGLIEIPL
ncbi:MAG: hypothetical protein AB2660_20885 [Candidatus Thiodiazotropha sp.]